MLWAEPLSPEPCSRDRLCSQPPQAPQTSIQVSKSSEASFRRYSCLATLVSGFYDADLLSLYKRVGWVGDNTLARFQSCQDLDRCSGVATGGDADEVRNILVIDNSDTEAIGQKNERAHRNNQRGCT